MSNDIRNWAKTIVIGDRKAKSIFLELADCADDNGYCFPKVADLAATLEMSVKTVERGLDYLVSKDRIERPDSDRNKGKFTNKATQILFGAEDISYIKNLRARRKKNQPNDKMTEGKTPSDKLTDGKSLPSDKLTDGNKKPSDNLSKNGQKPSVKLTGGEENHTSICPKPYDNLTVGQFDALNINKKDVFKTSTKTSIEEIGETSSPTPTELSTEQKQQFNEGMKFLKEKIGKFPDGAAQGKALKWMLLGGATIEQIKKYLVRQIEEYGETYRSSYLTLQKDIFRWIAIDEQKGLDSFEPFADEMEESEEIYFEEKPSDISLTDVERKKWSEFLANVRSKINPQVYQSWFEYLECEGMDSAVHKIFIRAQEVTRQWLETYYSQTINDALLETGLENFEIEWREK